MNYYGQGEHLTFKDWLSLPIFLLWALAITLVAIPYLLIEYIVNHFEKQR